MVDCISVSLKSLEKKRKELRDSGKLNHHYKIKKEGNVAFIPLIKNSGISRTINQKLRKIESEEDYKEKLEKILSKKELESAPHSFDIIGEICLLRLDESLKSKEKEIAKIFLSIHGIKSVYKREGNYEGELRQQRVKWLAGRKSKETVHKESGALISLDIEKVYFSVRSATERMRIASLIKKNEDVLVMFSGASPYECVIAKNSPANYILGIEKNKIANAYAKKNIALNKIEDKVVLYKGDVRKVVPSLNKKFDRIIMPLPHTGEDFLDIAAKASKKGTFIHLYQFDEWNSLKKMKEKYNSIIKKHIKDFEIKKIVKCGQFSPQIFRICIDIDVE